MEGVERNTAEWASTEARARFRETAEQLAVRLRWLSLVAIPILAYLSGKPIRSPWFEIVVASAGVYNLVVSWALAKRRGGPALSITTAGLDGMIFASTRRCEIRRFSTRLTFQLRLQPRYGEANGDSSLSR